jgi:uncharacterized membrane protein YdjX (TVP38/TMEM64 family)
MNNNLLSLLQEDTVFSAVISFVLMIIIAFIPAIPIPVIAGAIGTAFGFWPALLISWGGSSLGAFLMFLVLRFLFRKKVLRYIEGNNRLKVILKLLETNGFLAVLTARLLPIFPSVIVNLGASVSHISTRTFFIATLVGKLPTMITFTMAGNQLENRTWTTLILVGLYCMIIAIVASKVRKRIES